MKIWPLLFVLSLAANATLLVVTKWPRAGSSAVGERGSRPLEAPGKSGTEQLPVGSPAGEIKSIAGALKDGDVVALRDGLRAAGVSEELVRSVISARIWQGYQAQMKALQPKSNGRQEWWKNDENGMWGGQTKENRVALKALMAQAKAEHERVLGADASPENNGNDWLRRQYGSLTTEKQQAMQELDQDYNELAQDLQRETKGFSMPADAEKARFLREEQRKDLATILTPEEMADYDRRNSPTANSLRWLMTRMDASEAEYLAIYELKKEFDEKFNSYDASGNRNRVKGNDTEQQQARNDADKALKTQLRESLGAERYQDYIRASDHDYQQLQNATKRFGLPAETPNRLYALRDEVPKAATRIADDNSLTPEQKQAELKKLADQTRDRVTTALGAEVAQVYFSNNGMRWVGQLEKGLIITYDEHGASSTRRLDVPQKNQSNPKPKK
jgi:hypothetical protein